MERNEQYAEFEGLAVSLGAKCFEKWHGSLSRRGVTVEDAVQEGRVALLELIPRLEDPRYVRAQRIAFVSKSIRGRLRNWAAKASRNGDHRERPPEPAGVDPDEMLDLQHALSTLDPDVRSMVLERQDGASYRELAGRHGCSESVARRIVEKAMRKLKKLMSSKDS